MLFFHCLVLIFQSTLPTRGSDCFSRRCCVPRNPFQSTLPTRGSDPWSGAGGKQIPRYFNPRSPRGGATIALRAGVMRPAISIHAPHEGERRHMMP